MILPRPRIVTYDQPSQQNQERNSSRCSISELNANPLNDSYSERNHWSCTLQPHPDSQGDYCVPKSRLSTTSDWPPIELHAVEDPTLWPTQTFQALECSMMDMPAQYPSGSRLKSQECKWSSRSSNPASPTVLLNKGGVINCTILQNKSLPRRQAHLKISGPGWK